MAVTVIAVDGKVVDPSGTGWTDGALNIHLSAPGTVADGATQQVVGDQLAIPISATGAVSFNLVPNDNITPTDTVYVVEYAKRGGVVFLEHWTIAAADANPINIGNITRVASVSGGFVPTRWPTSTEANKPAANAGNTRKPFTVWDAGGNEHGEIVYRKADGTYGYWPLFTPF